MKRASDPDYRPAEKKDPPFGRKKKMKEKKKKKSGTK